MPIDVRTETVIDRPVDDVAAFAADPTNAPRWYGNIESVRWRTSPPLAIGSRLDFVAHFLGRKLVYTYEVTAWEPGRRLVMQTSEGPFPMATTYTWTAAGERTRMQLRNQGEPSGFASVATPLVAAATRRANRQDLAALKRLLESGVEF